MKKVVSLHEMAVRLCEGGTVWFECHSLRAVEVTDTDNPCFDCTMDCLCNFKMIELCAECEKLTGKRYRLKLVGED